MLIAPAGYGKTTLARQWLATREHAWYQGSTASPDVAALALGIAEAVSPMLPGVGRRLREWLPTSREPEDEVDVIADFLEADFAGWVEDTWFVIDDYHLLSSRASEELVVRLFLEKDRRVLLTSRRRPEWSSAREVLYGNFFELGQSSLAMTVEEANDVLAPTDNEAVEGLVALANGWPAVIGLAAMTTAQIERRRRPPGHALRLSGRRAVRLAVATHPRSALPPGPRPDHQPRHGASLARTIGRASPPGSRIGRHARSPRSTRPPVPSSSPGVPGQEAS